MILYYLLGVTVRKQGIYAASVLCYCEVGMKKVQYSDKSHYETCMLPTYCPSFQIGDGTGPGDDEVQPKEKHLTGRACVEACKKLKKNDR